jgi:hypothetical protein
MDINDLMPDSGALSYYTLAVRNAIDDHMTFLRNHPNNEVVNLSPKDIERFQGDLYGLFTAINIPRQYHYCVRRMNELESAQIVPEDLAYLVVPDYKVVDNIRQAVTSSNGVT